MISISGTQGEKAQAGTWRRLPWWRDRGTHSVEAMCLYNRRVKKKISVQCCKLCKLDSQCSPRTSVGAPGWCRPPLGLEHCNILPPLGSTTCTWHRGQKNKGKLLFTFYTRGCKWTYFLIPLFHLLSYISLYFCTTSNISSCEVFAGLFSVSTTLLLTLLPL